MCNAKDSTNVNYNIQILKDIEKIFENSSKLEVIGEKSNNAYSLLVNGYKEKRIVIKIPRKKDEKVDSLRYEYWLSYQENLV